MSAPLWRFSDGTSVTLSGEIDGTSAFANRLREDLELVSEGFPVQVFVDPRPCESVELRSGAKRIMHAWLMSFTTRYRVDVLESPYPIPGPTPIPVRESVEPEVVH